MFLRLKAWKSRSASELVGLSAALLVAALSFLPFMERMELTTHAVRFTLRRERPTQAKIVVIAIDDNTVKSFHAELYEQSNKEGRWAEPIPFWGTRLADVIEQVQRCNARVIGLDFLMAAKPDDLVATEMDKALERAKVPEEVAQRLRNDITPTMQPWKTFIGALEKADGNVVLADHPGLKNGPMDFLRYDLDVTQGCMGNAILPDSLDGTVWRAPLYTRQVYVHRNDGAIDALSSEELLQAKLLPGDKLEEKIIPGFAALLAARARGVDAGSEAALRRLGKLSPGVAERDRDVEFGINYIDVDMYPKGDRVGNIQHLSARRVASGGLTQAERDLLTDSVVLIGSTYAGNEDTHLGPKLHILNGVDIQAQAVATLLDGKTLYRWPQMGEALAILLIGIVAALAVTRLPFERGIFLVIAAELSWFLVVQGFFDVGGRMLPQVGPALALLLPFVACHLVRSLEETRRRHKIEALFGRSVSPVIRDHLMSHEDAMNLGGKRIEGSVLFFDIRGSTAFAQYQQAETVFSEFNSLFSVVVPEIERHGGLVNRYLGDGFMAVFGAPVPLPNHRQAAIKAAFAALRAVHAQNEVRPRIDGQPWRVGVGVNSGELAYGNLGQEERSEFTVMGDTINLAARLESMNKRLNSEIVFSVATLVDIAPMEGLQGPIYMPVDGQDADVPVYYMRREDRQTQEES